MAFHFTDEANLPLTPRDLIRYFARDGVQPFFGISSDPNNDGQIFYTSVNQPASQISGLTLLRLTDFNTLEELNPGVPIGPGQFGCGGMIYHMSADRKNYHVAGSENGLQFGFDYNPVQMGGMLDIDPVSTSGPSNTTTHTTYSGTVFRMYANYFALNKAIVARFFGRYNAGVAQTLRLRLFLGSQVLFDSTINTVNNAVNRQWDLEVHACVIGGGAGGQFRTYARFYDGNTNIITPILTTVAQDLTIDNDLALTAQWGAADPLNATILQMHFYEAKN